jgi:hypothetical protein
LMESCLTQSLGKSGGWLVNRAFRGRGLGSVLESLVLVKPSRHPRLATASPWYKFRVRLRQASVQQGQVSVGMGER